MKVQAHTCHSKNKIKAKNNVFNAQDFLDSTALTRTIREYSNRQRIYSQGDRADSVLYIQRGSVKLSVVNPAGKEAVVAILGSGDFFGESGLAGRTVRTATATAMTPASILIIEKNELIRVLHTDHNFSYRFISLILLRNIRTEEDLADHLLNSSEKRLARALLLLSGYGGKGPLKKLPLKVSQEVLAEMIGTTRSRVNFFMKQFAKKGFIEYENGLYVNPSLLSVVMEEQGRSVASDKPAL